MTKTVVIALGGNAILQPNEKATYENQYSNVEKCSKIIASLIKDGYNLLITHGNGPQVGNILRQNEECNHIVPSLPLDVCSAQSQGFIGYMMEQTLKNELIKANIEKEVVTLLTMTEVNPNDSAFSNPSKPIGKFYSEEEAKNYADEKAWIVKEDAGRGWRRVVPSPEPISILNAKTIRQLLNNDVTVIASGGGGIPVVKSKDRLRTGIEAVIDKDRSALKLAEEVEADVLMILTDVENVYINYGKSDQTALKEVSVREVLKYVEEGQFAAGSMGPKVEAALKFAETGGEAIICSLNDALAALKGEAGTRFVK